MIENIPLNHQVKKDAGIQSSVKKGNSHGFQFKNCLIQKKK